MKRVFTGGTWRAKDEDVVRFLKSKRRGDALKAAAAAAKAHREKSVKDPAPPETPAAQAHN